MLAAPLRSFTLQVTTTEVITFRPEFLNTSSPEYIMLIEDLLEELQSIFQGSFEITITNIYEGSLIVE